MGESLFLAREIGLDARLAFCEAKRKLPVKSDWRFAKQSANCQSRAFHISATVVAYVNMLAPPPKCKAAA